MKTENVIFWAKIRIKLEKMENIENEEFQWMLNFTGQMILTKKIK